MCRFCGYPVLESAENIVTMEGTLQPFPRSSGSPGFMPAGWGGLVVAVVEDWGHLSTHSVVFLLWSKLHSANHVTFQ